MSVSDVLRVEVIVVIAVILIIGTIIPGVRLYWPRRRDPVSRSGLGVALMGGALTAFAVLVLQLMIQYRFGDRLPGTPRAGGAPVAAASLADRRASLVSSLKGKTSGRSI
jgi:hypothetical protein